MPAPAPNARCGNRAVPPATGYIPPSSAWTSARTMMIAPAATHAQIGAGPGYGAAKYEPNSQPEPMIEVSDAHMAPINPISRFRPTSTGLVDTAEVSVAMIEPSFRSTYKKLTPASRPHANDHQRV